MRGRFLIGQAAPNCIYIPQRGEVFQYDRLGDGSWLTMHVGDGKTKATDLPAIADYDLHERVILLEKQIKEFQERINHE